MEAPKEGKPAYECDNFYLDMNGIIHTQSHPQDKPQPATEELMIEAIVVYLDRLVISLAFKKPHPERFLL